MPVASGFHTGGSTKTHTGHFCTNRLALLSQTRMDKGIVWAAASRASLSLQCGAVRSIPPRLVRRQALPLTSSTYFRFYVRVDESSFTTASAGTAPDDSRSPSSFS